MVADELMKTVFLGAGGRRPGPWMVSEQAELRSVLELPAGHSVYAIDVNAQTGSVAAGTRGGGVEVLSWPPGGTGLHEPNRRTLYQAAPVLAVCLVDEGRLVAADTMGRCLLWRFAEDVLPVELPCEGGRVCALVRLGEDRIGGLTEEGRLLLWDAGRRRLCKVIEGPAPCGRSALVRLVQWPAQKAVVYPTEGGQVACYTVADERFRSWQAHRCDCYGLVVAEDRLLTVGGRDGLLKVWAEPGLQAQDPCRCPRGIIAAERVGFDGEVLLVDSSGSAGVYTQEQYVMQKTCPLDGRLFRSLGGPCESQRRAFIHEQRRGRSQELCRKIQTQMAREDLDGLEDLHRELLDLGFGRVSLALRAQQAAQEQDLVGELAARRALASRLEGGDPRSVGSLQSFAALLVRAWCLQEAVGVYERIQACGVEMPVPDWLTQAAGVMAGSDCVAQAEGSVETLAEAADVMERPLRGRWVLAASDTLVFPQGGLTAQALADKYEQIRIEKGLHDLPGAQAVCLWWIERQQLHRHEAVFLEPPQTQGPVRCLLAMRLAGEDHQCLLVPCVVLDAGTGGEPADWRRHNRHVRRLCAQFAGDDPCGLWPTRIQNTVKLAVRRLRTSWLWLWRR